MRHLSLGFPAAFELKDKIGLQGRDEFQIGAHVGADDGQGGQFGSDVGPGAGGQAVAQSHIQQDIVERSVQGHHASGRGFQFHVAARVVGQAEGRGLSGGGRRQAERQDKTEEDGPQGGAWCEKACHTMPQDAER